MIASQAQAARDLIETLYRGGVRDVVVSPGSRNTPLVLAAEAIAGLRKTVVLDERCAGFIALGLSRCSARPALLICTSGSAAAHYLPAVVEAHAARVPLIVLSAARPEELDQCGAQQSLVQTSLFSDYTRLSRQAPLADERGAPAWRSLAVAALAACWGSPEGPVHLNLPFREPLWQSGLETSPCEGPEFLPGLPAPDRQALPNVAQRLAGKRGVIVCGAMHGCVPSDEAFAGAVGELAQALGWPVLCEPASRLRGRLAANEIAYGDRLHTAGFFTQQRVEAVVQLGAAPTSKGLRAWLGEPKETTLLVDRDGLWRDPRHAADLLVAGDEALTLTGLAAAIDAPVAGAWLAAWRRADQAAESAIDDAGWSEPYVLREALEKSDVCQVASSLSIRHIEGYLGPDRCPQLLLANRGLNGIDGTVSSGIGAALAQQQDVVVVLGDLALQHDLGGLAQAAISKANLAVLVIDNGGGGIFRRLPVAQHPTAFETYFETPQGLDIKAVAQALGLPAWQVCNRAELGQALPAWRQASGTRVLVAQVAADHDSAWRLNVAQNLSTTIEASA